MNRPFCEVRCTFVRCLYVGSTYIWLCSSRSLLCVVFGALAPELANGCMQRDGNLPLTFLGLFFIFFYLTFKPDCLIKLSKTCSKTLQMCPQTCLSREVLWSCKAQLCVFVRSFFFLCTFDSTLEAVRVCKCMACHLHCTWKMNLRRAAGILLEWLGCVRAF